MIRAHSLALAFLLAAGAVTAQAQAAVAAGAAPAAAARQPAPFARVGDIVITHDEYEAAFAQAARSKFYHGKPPENAVAALQREVAQSLVDAILVDAEARRRSLRPDAAAVRQSLESYEARYRGNAHWNANRERLLPGLKAKLERDSLFEQLKAQVSRAGEPTEAQLVKYWTDNKDKFTAPEQVHVSMILLKVDPSSPQAKWDATIAQANALAAQLKDGADFAALARQHSMDPASAARGGDLGFLHRGVLPEAAQEAVDKLKPGATSGAEPLLEGVGVFRLHERRKPKLNPLSAVRERATGLWQRAAGETAWTTLLEKLRRETPVQMDDSRFLPLATAAKSDSTAAPAAR